MSDLPEPLAKHIVGLVALDHGPVVRIKFDLVHAHCDCQNPHDPGMGDVECFNVWQNREVTVEFQDNSTTAMAELPTYNHSHLVSMFTGGPCGGMSGPLAVYCKVRARTTRWSYFKQLSNVNDYGGKWTGHDNGDNGYGRLVIVRSMKLINAGTWKPTAEELALFD